MSDFKGILTISEITNGQVSAISAEALGAGRKLADDKGETLSTVVWGSNISDIANQVIAMGADTVYTIEGPDYDNLENETILQLLKTVIEKAKPSIVIMGQNGFGRDIAPRLAFQLNAAVTLDCIELALENGRLLATKPVYGGNAQAVFSSSGAHHIVTIRSKAMAANDADASRHGEIIPIAFDISSITPRTKTRQSVVEESAGIKLEDAGVVVAGGRGIGSQEGFAQLEELAATLKGAVGASRPPCDSGWIADTSQIGLTGKIVAPDLYFAIAISGSSQHMSGCSGAKTIVAFNKDKEANIFRHARFGVVGDWKKILPAFTAKVKEITSA